MTADISSITQDGWSLARYVELCLSHPYGARHAKTGLKILEISRPVLAWCGSDG